MITTEVKVEPFAPQAIEQAVEKAAYKNVGHAAASIRKTSQASILRAEGPSMPGTPPHTHTRSGKKKRRRGNDMLKNAIVFAHDRKAQEAVVGPRYSVVGRAGEVHEFGRFYKGVDYPERPYMGPALDRNLDRFGASFGNSLGG